MANGNPKTTLRGLYAEAQRTMERLLRMPLEPQKEAAKLSGARAEAQRRRRERERERQLSNDASRDA